MAHDAATADGKSPSDTRRNKPVSVSNTPTADTVRGKGIERVSGAGEIRKDIRIDREVRWAVIAEISALQQWPSAQASTERRTGALAHSQSSRSRRIRYLEAFPAG